MTGTYVGDLPEQDGLHEFLGRIVSDRLGLQRCRPAFRVYRLRGSNEVYAYEEAVSGLRVIGKFYGTRFGWDTDRAERRAQQEYRALETLRAHGLTGSPHHVVRPLGLSRDFNCVLALEYYGGEQLSHAVTRSAHHGEDAQLFRRLTSLASFLATMHRRTAIGATVDFDAECCYLDLLVGRLLGQRVGHWDVEEFAWLRDRWRERSPMWQDEQVWLHGDATPANFLFGLGTDVAAIDLERMKRGDRMFDLGRVAGELEHAFLSATGDTHRAEPFVGHLVHEYSRHFDDTDATFRALTGRAPFYMGLNLLRIARNDYVTAEHGGRLVARAKVHLRTFGRA